MPVIVYAAAVNRIVQSIARLPCCNYDERLDRRCPGTATLQANGLEYLCDTCGGRCGSLVHPSCPR